MESQHRHLATLRSTFREPTNVKRMRRAACGVLRAERNAWMRGALARAARREMMRAGAAERARTVADRWRAGEQETARSARRISAAAAGAQRVRCGPGYRGGSDRRCRVADITPQRSDSDATVQ